MNVIARLEFELANNDSAVHRFNHYTTSPRKMMQLPTVNSTKSAYYSDSFIRSKHGKQSNIDYKETSYFKVTLCHILACELMIQSNFVSVPIVQDPSR